MRRGCTACGDACAMADVKRCMGLQQLSDAQALTLGCVSRPLRGVYSSNCAQMYTRALNLLIYALNRLRRERIMPSAAFLKMCRHGCKHAAMPMQVHLKVHHAVLFNQGSYSHKRELHHRDSQQRLRTVFIDNFPKYLHSLPGMARVGLHRLD